MTIRVFHRKKKKFFEEKVYGGVYIEFFYKKISRTILLPFLVRPVLSKLYGRWKSSFLTKASAKKFIRNYGINLEDFEKGSSKTYPYYKNFAEFFIRSFKKGKRSFIGSFSAFAEGRYLFYPELNNTHSYPVKDFKVQSTEILPKEISENFKNGSLIIARLAPVDYHRFHFPISGKVLKTFYQKGVLYSVSPIALKKKSKVFILNKRKTYLLETPLGKLAYVAVGATCVGKISFSKKEGETFIQGEEAGLFQFGGSTVLLYSEKPLNFETDLIEMKEEIFIELGESLLKERL